MNEITVIQNKIYELRGIVATVCRERIAYYNSKI